MVLLVLVGIAGASVVGWVAATAASAPAITTLKERDPGSNTEVLAADGTRLGFISADELSRPIDGDRMPQVLKDATVAIEDERFYRHQGVDYEGIVRAAVKNFMNRETVEGGSTLTMQLVKNLYTADRTREGLAGYQRKIREAKLAEELETEHPKEWILTKYLNTTPYGTVGGQTAIGAEAAARVYFNKRAKQLDLHEAALLAGLPQAPSAYSPIKNGPAAKRRRNAVLAKMAELGMVTDQQAQRAMRRGLDLNPSDYFSRRRESYFFDYVKDELIKQYGPRTVKLGGLVVHTTIDLDMQSKAREAIASQLGDIGPSSALVTIDPKNGYILAMASSADYADSKFNLAAQGERQPGSSFKTFALMTALRNGVDPDSTRYTSVSPTRINDPRYGPPFEIKTYGGTSGGNMNLVQATIAVRQLGLHPARARPRARQGGRHGGRHGHPPRARARLSGGVARRARGGRVAARDGDRVRDDRVRRLPQPADRHHQGHVPERQVAASAPMEGQAHEGVQGRDDLRGDPDPRAEHPGRHRHARRDRLSRRRQDRHHRPQHRRLVRGLHAAPGHRRVGRLSQRPHRDAHALLRRAGRRRHVPGRHLGRLHEVGHRQVLRRLQAAEGAVLLDAVRRRVLQHRRRQRRLRRR